MPAPRSIVISHCPGEHLVWARQLRERLRREWPRRAVHASEFDDDPAAGLPPPTAPVHPDPQLEGAALLIAMLGPFWLDRGATNYRTEADREREQVRADLAFALRRRLPVLLLRTGGARVPPAYQLPPELRPLAEGAALALNFDDPQATWAPMMVTLRRLLPETPPDDPWSAPAPASADEGEAPRAVRAWPVWLGPAASALVLALAAWWAGRGG